MLRLVGDDAHRPPAHPREAGDDRARPARLQVEPVAVVDDPPDHVVHVVRLARRVGQDVEQLLVHALGGVRGLAQRRRLLAVLREEGQVVLDRLDAVLVGLDLEVADAGHARVDARAAELLLGHVLAGHGLGEVRPGERHRAAALHHRHEVGEAGDVGGAGGARPHQRGHLRHDAAHDHLLAEEVAGAGEQRAGRLLDARAGRVEQPDQRDALRERQLAQARHLHARPSCPSSRPSR